MLRLYLVIGCTAFTALMPDAFDVSKASARGAHLASKRLSVAAVAEVHQKAYGNVGYTNRIQIDRNAMANKW